MGIDKCGIIHVNDYDQLKTALEAIKPKCHLDVIMEFEERMTYYNEIHPVTIHLNRTLTKKQLLILKERLKDENDTTEVDLHGTVQVFDNAVCGLIPRSGGELKFLNGTAKLEIPPDPIAGKEQEVFWIYRHVPDDKDKDEQSYLKAVNCCSEQEIMMYSLPVVLGPPNVVFQNPILLTLKDYSFPDLTTSSKSMSVYRSSQDNGTWENAGSCFPDNIRKTVTVPLNKMSSYVLGMPSESKLRPLNVHVMVQRLPQRCNSNEIGMVFSMNDYSYNQEMVSRNRMDIMCETCYYLNPKSDVIVKFESQDAYDFKHINQKAVLEKGRLYNLAEKIQSVTIPIKNTDLGSRIFVRLEQDNNVLVELSYINDRPKETQQKIFPLTNRTDERPPPKDVKELRNDLTRSRDFDDNDMHILEEKGMHRESNRIDVCDRVFDDNDMYVLEVKGMHRESNRIDVWDRDFDDNDMHVLEMKRMNREAKRIHQA